MSRGARAAQITVAALVAFPSVATAERRIALESTNPTCTPADRLEAEVSARGVRVDPSATVRLQVSADLGEQGVAIHVTGQNERGSLSARSMTASSCAEAIEAIALLVTLAADESAATFDAPASSETAPAPPSEPRATRASPATSVYVVLGVHAASLAEGQLGARASVGLAVDRSLVPWGEVGVVATLPRTIAGGGAEGTFTWIAGRAAVAPIGLRLGPRVLMAPYGGIEAGVVLASGSGPTKTESASRPWFAAVAGGRGRFGLGARWFVDVEAGAKVPIVRDDFVFVRGGAVYRVPAVGFEGGFAVGFHFP